MRREYSGTAASAAHGMSEQHRRRRRVPVGSRPAMRPAVDMVGSRRSTATPRRCGGCGHPELLPVLRPVSTVPDSTPLCQDRDGASPVAGRPRRWQARVLMSALTDTLTSRTSLTEQQVEHIARLVGEWQLLADLAFADLLLWVPVELPAADAGSVPAFRCVAQCRPTTGPTAYQHDQVGVVLRRGPHRAAARRPCTEARIYRDVDADWAGDLPIRREAIPVRHGDRVIAVVGRDANLASVRTPEPARAGLPAERRRPRRDGRRRHVPCARSRRPRRAPGRASGTGWSGSSPTGRSSTPARTRCRRSTGWASPARCSPSRSTP